MAMWDYQACCAYTKKCCRPTYLSVRYASAIYITIDILRRMDTDLGLVEAFYIVILFYRFRFQLSQLFDQILDTRGILVSVRGEGQGRNL